MMIWEDVISVSQSMCSGIIGAFLIYLSAYKYLMTDVSSVQKVIKFRLMVIVSQMILRAFSIQNQNV